MTTLRTAVVVGAGVAGLATAGALARAGWRVTLLEQQERLRTTPTALLLWPSGVRALSALGLAGGLDAIATPVPDRGVRRPDGQLLVPPHPAGDPGTAVLVHTEDLHDALVAGLGDRVEIRTGVTARPLPQGEMAAVTDGKTIWQADLLVAADGVDSGLRARVAPQTTVVSAGATVWRAVIPWYRAPELPPDAAAGGLTIGRGYRFFSAPLGRRGATGADSRGGRFWRATVTGAPRPESPETQLSLLRRWFADWHAPIGELLAATEPGDLVQQELRTLSSTLSRYATPIGDGALVLIGDAAHPVPEHLGLGACLALEDAATLVPMVRDAIPGRSLHTALARYQAARRSRLLTVSRRLRRFGASDGLSRLAPIQARRRERAITAAAHWEPPAG